jgi:hypothetical protein
MSDNSTSSLIKENSGGDEPSILYKSLHHVSSKTMGLTIAAGIYSITKAYVRGDKIALPFYAYTASAAALGATFFGSAQALKVIRDEEDVYNYAIPGLIHGALIKSVTSGVKKGAIAGVVGGVAGAGYFFLSNWFYEKSRQAWVEYRKSVIVNSKEKKLIVVKPNFPTNRREINLGKFPTFTENQTSSTSSTNPVPTSSNDTKTSSSNNEKSS